MFILPYWHRSKAINPLFASPEDPDYTKTGSILRVDFVINLDTIANCKASFPVTGGVGPAKAGEPLGHCADDLAFFERGV